MIEQIRGNNLSITVLIKDAAGVLVDPAGLSLVVKDPSNVLTTIVYPDSMIVRTSVGQYGSTIALISIGIWEYEWISTTPSTVSGGEAYVIADPVTSAPSQSSIVDYARMWMGGDNWIALEQADNFGINYIILAAETVKRRILATPPSAPLEYTLDGRVLDLLGISVALQLIPALRSYWASQIVSHSVGNDPAEIEVFTDRAKLLDSLQADLLRRLPAVQIAANPVIVAPAAVASVGQPGIDEPLDGARTTNDPRGFPTDRVFPYDPRYVGERWYR